KPRSRIHPLRARFQPGLQAGLDELVEVAVEHVLRVGAFDAGAQVLDPRLVEYVVADLAAPADVGLGGLQRVLLGVALLHFQLVQLRSEEHTSELQSRENLVCRLLLEKKKNEAN